MNINDIWSMKQKLLLTSKDTVKEGIFQQTGLPILFAETKSSITNVCARMPATPEAKAWHVFRAYTKDLKVSTDHEYKPAIIYSKKALSSWALFTATTHRNDVTFIFKNKEIFLETFKNLQQLSKNYTYKSNQERNHSWKRLTDYIYEQENNIIFSITIYNCKVFNPIYIADKTDSIGIAVELIDKKRSFVFKTPDIIHSTYLLMSNHKENIFYMDGVTIQYYSKSLDLSNHINAYEKIFKKDKKDKKDKKKSTYLNTRYTTMFTNDINKYITNEDLVCCDYGNKENEKVQDKYKKMSTSYNKSIRSHSKKTLTNMSILTEKSYFEQAIDENIKNLNVHKKNMLRNVEDTKVFTSNQKNMIKF